MVYLIHIFSPISPKYKGNLTHPVNCIFKDNAGHEHISDFLGPESKNDLPKE